MSNLSKFKINIAIFCSNLSTCKCWKWWCSISHTQPVDGEYLSGTIAFFICDDEYIRVGSLFVTCQESGIWSPESPTCEEGIAITYHYQISELLFIFNEILLKLDQLQRDTYSSVCLFFYSDLYRNKLAKWRSKLQYNWREWKIHVAHSCYLSMWLSIKSIRI